MNERTIIFGDVHGMLLELHQLMNIVAPNPGDKLVFCGDILDKGPEVVQVVSYLRTMREGGFNVVLVLGNHEEKHARFRMAFERAGEKGIKKFKGVAEMRALTDALSPADVEFLDSAVPFRLLPEHDAVVVHGGILPLWEKLDPGDKSLLNQILRLRYVRGVLERKITVEFTVEGEGSFNIPQLVKRAESAVPLREQRKEKGSFLGLGQESPNDPFWADVYDGRFGHVFFGHSPYIGDKVETFRHATGLDTGAVFGGSLSAAVLEVGQPTTFVNVPAVPREGWDFAGPLEAFKE